MDGEKPQTRELVDGGVLEQAELRACNTLTRHNLYVHLNAFPRMGHLLVWLGFVRFFGFSAGNSPILRMTRNRLSGQRV